MNIIDFMLKLIYNTILLLFGKKIYDFKNNRVAYMIKLNNANVYICLHNNHTINNDLESISNEYELIEDVLNAELNKKNNQLTRDRIRITHRVRELQNRLD